MKAELPKTVVRSTQSKAAHNLEPATKAGESEICGKVVVVKAEPAKRQRRRAAIMDNANEPERVQRDLTDALNLLRLQLEQQMNMLLRQQQQLEALQTQIDVLVAREGRIETIFSLRRSERRTPISRGSASRSSWARPPAGVACGVFGTPVGA